MKSWRIITTAALLALASTPAIVLASSSDLSSPSLPRVPSAAVSPVSPTSPTSGGTEFNCEVGTGLADAFPLVMCVERTNTSNPAQGSEYPWTNDDGLNPFYRNQYMYPSAAVVKVALRAVTIESIHSRGLQSMSGNLTLPISYNAPLPQWVRVYKSTASTLSPTFDNNTVGLTPDFLNWEGPKTIGQISGTAMGGSNPNPYALSDFVSRGPDPLTRNDLDMFFDFRNLVPADTNILVDALMRLGGPQDTVHFPLWDVTLGACSEPTRATGGSPFSNTVSLTTAIAVDQKAFVWVFRGKVLPPPSTIQQQIAEIIRLLVTPEGLRCTGLDLTPNGRAEDNPIAFPQGADWDPIAPGVTTGKPETGEEAGDGAEREQGWIE